MLQKNQKAPEFSLPSTSGETVELSKIEGPFILYFYPKDNTKVCTKQACEFRDNFDVLKELNIAVYGVSTDSVKKHIRFKEKNNLPFELLSDQGGKVSKKYKAYIPFIGMSKRITYLIDANKQIVAGFSDLFNAESHIKAMLKNKDLV
ncbi:peroxiredoxin [Fulvivirga sp. RKSG066]|uniref:peroxiredoxin n=1 Tax=Fulvivirga aurantia TaxID=2529383 RepID=UPI0012BCA5ED|nr:peroxiredoxin [Fulvivirga aurantia]MTI21924.1 peroxiredoxin [Fulvivirga aurantia]